MNSDKHHCKAIICAVVLGFSATAGAATHTFTDSWGAAGFTLTGQSGAGVDLVFSLPQITLSSVSRDGQTMQALSFPGVSLPGQPGAPDLPTVSRLLAIPSGAQVQAEIIACRERVFHGIDLIPTAEIPREDAVAPPVRSKDPAIYGINAGYPSELVTISRAGLRGVDVAILSVTPFRYNPVTRDLTVYCDLRLRIAFSGGGGLGDDRLRGRWWEPLLRQNLLNYTSLPPTERDLPDPSDDENCEYLIITPDNPVFLAWADTIRQWREEQGIITSVVSLSRIGGNDTTLIRDYLRNAYQTWTIPPQAVLLMSDFRPNGDNSGIASPLYCGYVTDNLYADMNNDYLPDLVISRLAVEDEAQLSNAVGKMLDYERNPSTDVGFYQHPLLAGAWYQYLWYILCNETVYGYWHNQLGKDPVRQYCIGDGSTPDSLWSTGLNTSMVTEYFGPSGLGYLPAAPNYLRNWGGNAPGINSSLNQGAFLVQYRGHGWVNGWSLPGYGIVDLPGLSNQAYPYVISTTCWTGNYANTTPCFAESFQRLEHGALGLIAASSPTYSFVNDVFVWGMYDHFWPNFDPGYGPGSPGETHLLPAFASVAGKYYLAASAWPPYSMAKVTTYNFFEHLGETFMRLYSEPPALLSVSHDSVIHVGAATLAVTADPGSLIALSRSGELITRADGTGAPVEMPLPELSPGQRIRVTVTKDNYYRYMAEAVVVDNPSPISPQEESLAPGVFALNPPTPNPFNPSTVASFKLRVPSHVTLKVYDTAGRLVATLVDGWREAGTHEATFDGSGLASGIYLAKIESAEFTAIQKLVLMK